MDPLEAVGLESGLVFCIGLDLTQIYWHLYSVLGTGLAKYGLDLNQEFIEIMFVIFHMYKVGKEVSPCSRKHDLIIFWC